MQFLPEWWRWVGFSLQPHNLRSLRQVHPAVRALKQQIQIWQDRSSPDTVPGVLKTLTSPRLRTVTSQAL